MKFTSRVFVCINLAFVLIFKWNDSTNWNSTLPLLRYHLTVAMIFTIATVAALDIHRINISFHVNANDVFAETWINHQLNTSHNQLIYINLLTALIHCLFGTLRWMTGTVCFILLILSWNEKNALILILFRFNFVCFVMILYNFSVLRKPSALNDLIQNEVKSLDDACITKFEPKTRSDEGIRLIDWSFGLFRRKSINFGYRKKR